MYDLEDRLDDYTATDLRLESGDALRDIRLASEEIKKLRREKENAEQLLRIARSTVEGLHATFRSRMGDSNGDG